MTNGISNLQTLPGTLATNSTEAPRKTSSPDFSTADSPSQPSAQAADKANLSTLGGLVAQASAGSDVRLDKVAALQQSIASGTYNVPASAVASKIVDSLLS
jgi:negative regulator of flagellin synthesis FlgM